MKYNKIFRTLALAIILSLLMIAIPATPALAYDRDISLSPSSGKIGDTVTITGDDFVASTDTSERWARIFFAKDEAVIGDGIDDEVNTYKVVRSAQVGYVDEYDEGEFEATFKVPAELTGGSDDEDVVSGTYYVYVTITTTTGTSTYIRTVAEFTVIGGEITLYPVKGPVGTEVEISGEDFGTIENIFIEYDGVDIKIQSGDRGTDRYGEFWDTIIIIPESTAGDYTITVIGDESGNEVDAVFTVEPEITISPTSGGVETMVTVSGTGFGYRSDVTIYFKNARVATVTTDRYGSFDTTFDVPAITPGTYDVEAWDEDDNSDRVEFTIGATASLNPTTGNVGTKVTVSGSGFIAGGTVTIKYDDALVATITVGADGIFFPVTFTVPASQYGDHNITVTDGTNIKQFTFTMESEAPPIPVPLKPEMGVKAEAEAYFDWEDVDDPSLPITYTLQIASNADFTTIVLEKKDLTSSEYTITKEERLPSVKKEAPYYWRVKAIDGASNVGEWSGVGSFYVGFAFAMPTWAIYTLFAIGALLLGALGFYLGRRTTYY